MVPTLVQMPWKAFFRIKNAQICLKILDEGWMTPESYYKFVDHLTKVMGSQEAAEGKIEAYCVEDLERFIQLVIEKNCDVILNELPMQGRT